MLSWLLSWVGEPLVRICRVNDVIPTRVLLGKLEPILLVGLRRVLAEDGIDIVGQEQTPTGVVTEALRLQPDVVLLDLDSVAGEDLSHQIQSVAPQTKVILWARDETVMEVLDPSCGDARLVAITATGELRRELTSNSHRHREEDD
jgi:AmiR/NasT family two-component response regulator